MTTRSSSKASAVAGFASCRPRGKTYRVRSAKRSTHTATLRSSFNRMSEYALLEPLLSSACCAVRGCRAFTFLPLWPLTYMSLRRLSATPSRESADGTRQFRYT